MNMLSSQKRTAVSIALSVLIFSGQLLHAGLVERFSDAARYVGRPVGNVLNKCIVNPACALGETAIGRRTKNAAKKVWKLPVGLMNATKKAGKTIWKNRIPITLFSSLFIAFVTIQDPQVAAFLLRKSADGVGHGARAIGSLPGKGYHQLHAAYTHAKDAYGYRQMSVPRRTLIRAIGNERRTPEQRIASIGRMLERHRANARYLLGGYDNQGKSPLAYALDTQNNGLIQALLDAHADPNAYVDSEGHTPLTYAYEVARHRDLAVVDMLIRSGAGERRQDKNGDTIVSLAADPDPNEGNQAILRRFLPTDDVTCPICATDRDTRDQPLRFVAMPCCSFILCQNCQLRCYESTGQCPNCRQRHVQ